MAASGGGRGRHQVMGRASMWAQWSIIAAAVLLSPLLILLTVSLIGWAQLRKQWVRVLNHKG
jgi:hypothetical protein